MILWATEARSIKDFMIVRYEDLRARPQETLARGAGISRHAGHRGADCGCGPLRVLRQHEADGAAAGVLAERAAVLVPKDRSNPNSYKVRRGKVAGYRDDFHAAQLARIDRLVETTLDPLYGYTGAARPGRQGNARGRGLTRTRGATVAGKPSAFPAERRG